VLITFWLGGYRTETTREDLGVDGIILKLITENKGLRV
jgi:hypothetical protein